MSTSSNEWMEKKIRELCTSNIVIRGLDCVSDVLDFPRSEQHRYTNKLENKFFFLSSFILNYMNWYGRNNKTEKETRNIFCNDNRLVWLKIYILYSIENPQSCITLYWIERKKRIERKKNLNENCALPVYELTLGFCFIVPFISCCCCCCWCLCLF